MYTIVRRFVVGVIDKGHKMYVEMLKSIVVSFLFCSIITEGFSPTGGHI